MGGRREKKYIQSLVQTSPHLEKWKISVTIRVDSGGPECGLFRHIFNDFDPMIGSNNPLGKALLRLEARTWYELPHAKDPI